MLQATATGGSSFVGDVLILALYFAPSIIAISRKSSNVGSISLLNLLLGWTVVGWVMALVKAVKSTTPKVRSTVALSTCSNCGAGLSPGQQFCFCGAPRSASK